MMDYPLSSDSTLVVTPYGSWPFFGRCQLLGGTPDERCGLLRGDTLGWIPRMSSESTLVVTPYGSCALYMGDVSTFGRYTL